MQNEHFPVMSICPERYKWRERCESGPLHLGLVVKQLQLPLVTYCRLG